jgi:hypothetical protein
MPRVHSFFQLPQSPVALKSLKCQVTCTATDNLTRAGKPGSHGRRGDGPSACHCRLMPVRRPAASRRSRGKLAQVAGNAIRRWQQARSARPRRPGRSGLPVATIAIRHSSLNIGQV